MFGYSKNSHLPHLKFASLQRRKPLKCAKYSNSDYTKALHHDYGFSSNIVIAYYHKSINIQRYDSKKMAMPVGWCSALVHAEKTQQILDALPLNSIWKFKVSKG